MTHEAFVRGTVTVSVPATSANLGPGYDTLGLALDLRDELTGEVLAAGDTTGTPHLEVVVEGEGADGVPLDESHLVVRAMRTAFEQMGLAQPSLRLHCRNVLPHSRGLGSSSAAIVGGLALARALVLDGTARIDDTDLFALAAKLEGHPDNVAPATFGGFTVSGAEAGNFFAVPAPVVQGTSVVVFVPPDPVSTEVARGLLPREVPHADAAANAARAALLVVALGQRPDLLPAATRDYLHQDYRASAMPDSAALVRGLRADGVAAVISGAGPTVLAFVGDGEHSDEIDPVAVDSAGALLDRCPAGWAAHHLAVDLQGVVVR
ncbi:homoserine kinase [Nocardioides zeae]|uniref:Homoserine kinase n=1 Tax=Nocardioides imazamoxiresistens TaxID=3231893 RepID=A0ABU3Q0Y0_9ACTN|nr:homoserine kinase [Nocardioides zeae]MDT9595096.1 homoserine kinase [Nocardioides zeae]